MRRAIVRELAWQCIVVAALLASTRSAAAYTLNAHEVVTLHASHYNCRKPGECSRSKITANGERFNEHAMTAAHKSLPFGTRLQVCRGSQCVVVRINDRGPFIRGRQLDLTTGAAHRLGFDGVAAVRCKVLP